LLQQYSNWFSVIFHARVDRPSPAAADGLAEPHQETIRNKNTRMAYYRAECHVFAWVEQHEIG
jgi:hypothetical protein